MAKRCAFYVKDGRVIREVYDLQWTLGFTKEAKLEYIKKSYATLSETISGKIIDVTSANKTVQYGYILSPYYMVGAEGSNLEGFYKNTVKEDMAAEVRMLYFDWLYGVSAFSSRHECIELINEYDVFIDIFHRPDEGHCTQAKSCAILKLALETEDAKALYANAKDFYEWRCRHVNFII